MHQKMAWGLKFRIKEEEELHCLCSENKGADQLRGSDREANFAPMFSHMQKAGFIMRLDYR